jgi:hypothetical protein
MPGDEDEKYGRLGKYLCKFIYIGNNGSSSPFRRLRRYGRGNPPEIWRDARAISCIIRLVEQLNHTLILGVVQLRFAWTRILPPAATRERNARHRSMAWALYLRGIAREVQPLEPQN